MPQITLNFLTSLYTGVNTSFNKYLGSAPGHYKNLCMMVDSNRREETYPRLDMLPGVREWVGDRVVHSLAASTYTVKNKKFEETIGIDREDIEDDNFGLFNIAIQQLGVNGAEYPDRLVANLLNTGDTTVGPDGQYFFDVDHPSWDATAAATSASNFTSGSSPAWYLFDLSKPLKPLLFQMRQAFQLVARQSLQDPAVFDRDQLLWGTRGRMNAGYGLWHLGYKSKAALSSTNFEAAFAAMRSRFRPDGAPIGITPTHLMVGPSNEGAGRRIVNNELITSGTGTMESNPWKNSVQLLVNPYLP